MPDTIILSLKQAQSVFPVSTWKCVNDIILKNYLIINNAFEGFNAFETLLEEDQKQAVKTAKLLEIETAVKNILPEIKGIILKVDIDLCIADLHEVRGIYNDGLKYEDDFEKEVKND
ncbi:MAG: hypothetical protein K5768_01340 [Firmicutes bacterium]|nr:hypothetical protein [Bacillota bacterium]